VEEQMLYFLSYKTIKFHELTFHLIYLSFYFIPSIAKNSNIK